LPPPHSNTLCNIYAEVLPPENDMQVGESIKKLISKLRSCVKPRQGHQSLPRYYQTNS
jgi:hypothetical protein